MLGSNVSSPLSRKSFLLKIFLGLTLLLLVACASASIVPEGELVHRPATDAAAAAKPGLFEPPEAISQQGPESVIPAAIPSDSILSTENAGEELEPISSAPEGTGQVATDISSGDIFYGVTQSEPTVTVEEAASEVSLQPVLDPSQATAAGPVDSSEDASPQISLLKAPVFTLTSASSEPFSLETYRGESKVVLVFFRGFW